MNIFTIIQQKVTNRIKIHEAEEQKAHPELKIVNKQGKASQKVPPKKKR
jgi:membrane protein insertase Oxa1/YidC/SpoIIIJ